MSMFGTISTTRHLPAYKDLILTTTDLCKKSDKKPPETGGFVGECSAVCPFNMQVILGKQDLCSLSGNIV
jgi:hypothetical protein